MMHKSDRREFRMVKSTKLEIYLSDFF
uniref:Uncharacterized protein n=1 Tax=Anguilla anguilla TaxID=7936 RepID=A0A0E9PQM7_ANGAN